MKYNPKLKDFMEQKPHLTLLGLAWALYWRATLTLFAISLAVVIFVGAIPMLVFILR